MGQHVGHILQDFRLLPRPKGLSLSALSFLYVFLNLVRKLWDINIGIQYKFTLYMNSKDFNIFQSRKPTLEEIVQLCLQSTTVSTHKSRAFEPSDTSTPPTTRKSWALVRKHRHTAMAMRSHTPNQLHSATVYKQIKSPLAMLMAKYSYNHLQTLQTIKSLKNIQHLCVGPY